MSEIQRGMAWRGVEWQDGQEVASHKLPCFQSWPAPGQHELGMEGLIQEVEEPCLPKCPGNEV